MTMGGMLGILDSLTGGEVIMVLLVALLVIGPDRLPDTARTMGQWLAKLRSMTTNLQSEVREVLDDPAMKPIRDVGEFVAAPRRKLVEFATAAEAEAAEAKRLADDAEEAAAEAEAAALKARALAEEAVQQADEAIEDAKEATDLVAELSEEPEVSIERDAEMAIDPEPLPVTATETAPETTLEMTIDPEPLPVNEGVSEPS